MESISLRCLHTCEEMNPREKTEKNQSRKREKSRPQRETDREPDLSPARLDKTFLFCHRGTIDPVPVEYRRNHRLKVELTWKFQVRSAETYWNQRMPGSWRERNNPENRACDLRLAICEISLARLSLRLPLLCGAGIQV